jgi:hypothetical protein
MHLTNTDANPHILPVESEGLAGAPVCEVEVTPAMIEAGADCLEEYIRVAGGLSNSADFVAERVFRAMEKLRMKR